MSEINFKNITEKAAVLAEKAAIMLPPETAMSIECSWDDERVPAAQGAIYDLTDNFITAGTTGKPVCPLCGGVVVTVKGTVGADDKEAAISAAADGINAGLAAVGMKNPANPVKVYFAESDNGELTVRLAGCGASEAAAVMQEPSCDDVAEFASQTVKSLVGGLCAPVFVGIGFGSTEDEASLMAEIAITRKKDRSGSDPAMRKIEQAALSKINALGIGAMGYTGLVTALTVAAEGKLPESGETVCAVKLSCHACRAAKCGI